MTYSITRIKSIKSVTATVYCYIPLITTLESCFGTHVLIRTGGSSQLIKATPIVSDPTKKVPGHSSYKILSCRGMYVNLQYRRLTLIHGGFLM